MSPLFRLFPAASIAILDYCHCRCRCSRSRKLLLATLLKENLVQGTLRWILPISVPIIAIVFDAGKILQSPSKMLLSNTRLRTQQSAWIGVQQKLFCSQSIDPWVSDISADFAFLSRVQRQKMFNDDYLERFETFFLFLNVSEHDSSFESKTILHHVSKDVWSIKLLYYAVREISDHDKSMSTFAHSHHASCQAFTLSEIPQIPGQANVVSFILQAMFTGFIIIWDWDELPNAVLV